MEMTAKFRRLTADEERAFAMLRLELTPEEWRVSEARRLLIESCIPWAMNAARRAGGLYLGEDRYGVALHKLCRLVDSFEPERGRLTTYMAESIRREICRAETEQGTMIRVPEDVQEYVRLLDEGANPRPRRPTMPALVPFARAALAPMWRDSSSSSQIPDPREQGPDDGPDEGTARLLEEVDRLPAHLTEIVRLYHFHDPGSPPSIAAIGRRYGISKETARIRLQSAYRRLREALGGPLEMTA